MTEITTTKSYRIDRPSEQLLPIVLASPHSGADYPADLIKKTNLTPLQLRRSEDAFVDQLYEPAVANGVPLIRARLGRVFVDLNREPYELDPGMFDGPLPAYANTRSPRLAAGLGTIAKVIASGETIYNKRLSFKDVSALLDTYYKPYHDALAKLLEETKEKFGMAILIDCHSMPSTVGLPGALKGRAVDFVLGDCHRSSCDAGITALVDRHLERLGYRVLRNRPYAGGYTTQNYGRPSKGIHALQVEINRALYMDEALIEPMPSVKALSEQLANMVEALGRGYLSAAAAE
ncbi:MAG: N-formylglutamate amidohydrolase [Alphaproteobacteria bacterium]|nr:N-formylglutamate amidohydrolase [Alphaproteobacteria bacterium SS10]